MSPKHHSATRQTTSILAVALLCLAQLFFWRSALADPVEQAATPAPPPLRVEAYQEVRVRAGPGTDYDIVGVMVVGQVAEILGQVPLGRETWYKIVYIGGPDNEGWVHGGLVRVVGNASLIPFLTPPSTPTLPPTATSEGAGAGETVTPVADASHLPTFTPPSALVRPTLLPVAGVREGGGLPPALVIFSLFVLGSFGTFISLLRRRG
jgi:uncharacterized protein YraI